MGGKNRTSFQPGQVANPHGRPPKNRALTTILERAGNKTIGDREGKKTARKRVIAELAWSVVTTGKATFPDGTVLQVSPQDWFDVLKWIYNQIDGPPKQTVQVDIEYRIRQIAEENGFDPDEAVKEAQRILSGARS